MRPVLRRIFAGIIATLAVLASSAAPPRLDRAEPRAVAPGAETEIVLRGRNLGGSLELWTSFEATAALVSNRDDFAIFKIKAAPAPRAGVGAIRLATTNGLSNLAVLMIDDLPAVAVAAGHSPSNTPTLAAPAAVEGEMPKLGLLYYRFEARQGEAIGLEVVAQRIGSSADPVLRVLDLAGRELAYSDDAPGGGADSRLRFVAPRSEDYIIELRDMNYEGGSDYFYRLRLGDIALPVCAYPLGVAPGQVSLRWTDLSGALETNDFEIPAREPLATLSVRGSRACSGWVDVEVARGTEIYATATNNAAEHALHFGLPAILNGEFAQRGRTWFEFEARKDQRVAIRSRARGLGSPCDPYFEILDAKGGRVAKSRYAEGIAEDTLTNRFDSDGVYRVSVEEMDRRSGPGLSFRLQITDLKPGFDLSVSNSAFAAPAGEPLEFAVTARRRDYKGPINLRLEPATATNIWALEDAVIPGDKSETTLKLVPAPDSSTNHSLAIQFIRLVGFAKIAGAEVTAPVSTLDALERELPRLPRLALRLDGLLALGRGEAPAPLESRGKKKKK